MATSDLSSVMVPQPASGVRYSMGRLISWNTDTFENVVDWNGLPIQNMKVANPVDALSYAPDMYVSLLGFDSSGAEGITQWVIWGRLIEPGADGAEQAVAFLRGSLARQISAEIFVDRIHPVFDQANAQRDSVDWGDPTNGASAGPAVTGVDIVTGAALIVISVGIEYSTSNNAANANPRVAGVVSVEITGATNVAPDEETGVSAQSVKSRSGAAISLVDGVVNASTMTAVYLQTGLNAGLHDFTLKYRKWSSASDYVNVDQRSLTVIAF